MILSKKTEISLYLIILIAHIALVWMLPYFPSQDGPNHLNSLYILKDLLQGGQHWAKYYSPNLNLVPNLGFTLIAFPLTYVFQPLTTERLFISLFIILLAVSVPLLIRSFGRPAMPYSFFVFPAIFNYSMLMGFYSYVISVPFFILSFLLALKVRHHSLIFRFISLNLVGLTLFFFHLIPFAFYLISLVAITLSDSKGFKQILRNLLHLDILISPLLVMFFMYLVSKPKSLIMGRENLISFHRIIVHFTDLLTFGTINLSPWQIVPAFSFMFLIILMMYETIKEIGRKKSNGIPIPDSDKALIFLPIFLTAIYMLAPSRIGDGGFFNQRFPWVILVLLLPFLHYPKSEFSRHFVSGLTIVSVLLFFAVTSRCLWQENLKVATFTKGLQTNIPPGSFVMTIKPVPTTWPRMDSLEHASAYYGIFGGCIDAGNYEVNYDLFQIRLKKDFPSLPLAVQVESNPATIPWPSYPSLAYLLTWGINTKKQEDLSRWFRIVFRNEPLTIWHRK